MPRIDALARQAMLLARNHIVMHLRFMDMAVFRLQLTPSDATLATDGARLYYGAKHVLRRYMRVDQQGLAQDMLHVLLHCVFRHPFIASLVEQPRWDLACDIAVADIILSMNDPHFALPGDDARRAVIERLRREARPLTAERLYRHFADHPPEPDWHELFYTDDHVLWHKPNQAREMRRGDGDADGGESGGAKSQNDGGQATPEEEKTRSDGGGESPRDGDTEQSRMSAHAEEAGGQTGQAVGQYDERRDSEQHSAGPGMDTEGLDGMAAGSRSRSERTEGGLDAPHSTGVGGDSGDARSQSDAAFVGGSGSGLNDALLISEAAPELPPPQFEEADGRDSRDQIEREWKDVGERIQADLETFSRRRGESAGSLLAQLNELNREKIDYAAFLRKFAVLGETAEIDNDDFDHIFYTYGLKLYGNLPLIEPLETREVLRVRDFVIAIDTSGSTSGALVKRFLETTWGILKGEENFFKKINLYVIQCDARIQEAVRIDSQRAFDEYMAGFEVKGLGGTDFRPVFMYVDELLRQGCFTRLKGLIYFTDGIGTYPARKPDYETAFVFLRGGAEPPAVPPWAIRVVLED